MPRADRYFSSTPQVSAADLAARVKSIYESMQDRADEVDFFERWTGCGVSDERVVSEMTRLRLQSLYERLDELQEELHRVKDELMLHYQLLQYHPGSVEGTFSMKNLLTNAMSLNGALFERTR